MAVDSDVIVIGGGIAGAMSALSAAQNDGVERIRLISASQSTLRSASGLIDVLGIVPPETEPIARPYAQINRLSDTHPYRILGIDAITAGLEQFDTVVEDRYHGDHTERNALVVTTGGAVKPTARYPASTAAGLASDDREMLLVGFDRLTDFDAPLAADHLDRMGVPFDVRGVTIEFPGDLRPDAKITRYAEVLDGNPEGSDDCKEIRQSLARRIDTELDGAKRVGLPAVLGLDQSESVRRTLESVLGVAVFEIPMGPPSLLGMRLETILFDALDREGVTLTIGNRVVDFTDRNDRIESVILDRNGAEIPHRADQYILATGGLVGSGIDTDRNTVREPLFGCHVPHPSDRYQWFDDATFGNHAFATFGVRIDEEARPLTADGSPEFRNLRAAGTVIGGYDFAAEKSGSGVSIATGYVAGSSAATEAASTRST